MFSAILFFACCLQAKLTPEQIKQLPPPAPHPIDFAKEIKPILETSCMKCHGRGKSKGGFQIDTKETFLKNSDSGPAVIVGNSGESYLITLVAGLDPDSVMPKKGSRLTTNQIALLRAWIDQGLRWDSQITFAKPPPLNLKPREPQIPLAKKVSNPIDAFVSVYFQTNKVPWPETVSDRIFARRVYLDVIGLLPSPEELSAFISDKHSDKRERLVQKLLLDNQHYAEHWLSFWNDLLRNDYSGTGYIDGGRKQITGWLYSALATNLPYDQFVSQLVNPTPASEGFSKGIVWRGVVNASQVPQMQAAQNISQVFMGLNLKCASCHDSFINDWQLADSYALANIYSEEPLELFQCDKPTGQKAAMKFLFPELGVIEAKADKPARLKQLAQIMTCEKNGRLSRTIVNRLWAKFFGRALVEPVDDMEQIAWNQDLLDWLAEDLVKNKYDLKKTIERILTSRAYQLPATNLSEQNRDKFIFAGPGVRRLSAEQFRDALTSLTGIGYSAPMAEINSEAGFSAHSKYAPVVPARWIWITPNSEVKAKAEIIYLRKSVNLSTAPVEAAVMIMCDNSFTLFVNGKKAGEGSDYAKSFLFDLQPFLKKGENVIAVQAINHLPDNSLPTPEKAVPGTENPAGLFVYARVRGTGTNIMDFATDKTWIVTNEKKEGWEKKDFAAENWKPASERERSLGKPVIEAKFAAAYPGKVRAALVAADPLLVALGRPNREQVVTTRATEATTLQGLELTNGGTLSDILKRGAAELVTQKSADKHFVPHLYEQALGREPTSAEMKLAEELVGQPIKKEGVEDLLWAMTMLPEFQLIY
ncbi:MAG: DUF1549 domain-containing protein [Verrucomicrobiota bacterium]|nr:DUF1549 domain-containing protein [Verrucomicrobiota bacterium]